MTGSEESLRFTGDKDYDGTLKKNMERLAAWEANNVGWLTIR